jgi:hypothetical protein
VEEAASILGSAYIVPDMLGLTAQQEERSILEGGMLDDAFGRWHVSTLQYRFAAPDSMPDPVGLPAPDVAPVQPAGSLDGQAQGVAAVGNAVSGAGSGDAAALSLASEAAGAWDWELNAASFQDQAASERHVLL